MPTLAIGLEIASLVAAGVGTGASIYESDKNRDATEASEQAAQAAQTKQAAQQAATQKQEALKAAIPNAQAQTGGSLTGAGAQSFANILAGYAGATGSPGSPQTPSNASTVGATNAPQASGSATPTNFTDLLKQLQGGGGGNFSGGTSQTPPPDLNFSLSSAY